MKEEKYHTVIIRPNVDSVNSQKILDLEVAFATFQLVDKTVCEDRIVYIFQETNKNA